MIAICSTVVPDNCQCYHSYFDPMPNSVKLHDLQILKKAVQTGNDQCIVEMVQKWGASILEYGIHGCEEPSLYTAVRNKQYKTVVTLIGLKANINTATVLGRTALWAAAQIVHDVSLVKLLLRNGAIATPALKEDGLQVIEKAQTEITEESKTDSDS